MFKHSIFKIFLLATGLLMSTGMWSAVGFWTDDAAGLKLNYSGSTDALITTNASDLAEISLGNIQKLYLKEWYFKTYRNTDDLNWAGELHYMVYPVGNRPNPEAWVNKNMNYNLTLKSNNTGWPTDVQFGENGLNVNLLEGLSAGEYVLEYFFKASFKNGTNEYLSNNNKNYKITFSYKPAVASNHLFGTYQGHNQPIFIDGHAGNRAEKVSVDYYVATCGNTVLGKVVENNGKKMWPDDNTTAIRTWNNDVTSNNSANLNGKEGSGEVAEKWTADADMSNTKLSTRGETFPMSIFVKSWAVSGKSNHETSVFTYRRNYINNPTSDNVAPTLDVASTTIDASGENIVVTFGNVTANEEYFYYVADENYGLAAISLNNVITIAKPANEDGKTYNFICCAVDYNGNMSLVKQYSYTDTFNPEKNLALNKPSEAGTQQGDGVKAPKANNGNESDFWTCYGTGTSNQWWWSVDLGDNYDVNRVRILFNDRAGSFQILSSVDGTNWSVYAAEASGYPVDITYNTLASARYFKFVSTHANVGIKEFEVYGIGIHTEDTEAPVLTAANVENETISDNTATINVTASDNVAVATCHLVDNANNFDETFDYNGGTIALTNLAPSTTYTFTVTVADLAGNVSTPFNMEAFTTRANTHIPSTAAPVPTHAEDDVLSLYSDTYESIKLNSTHSWGNLPVSNGNIQGNNYLLYEVTKPGMDNGIEFGSKDISEYSYMHVDVWSEVNATITFTVADAACTPLALTAQTWTSANLAIPASAPASISHIKLNQWSGDINVNIAVDNVYFWKELKYTRDVTANSYGTICMPYGAAAGAWNNEEIQFYSIAYKTNQGGIALVEQNALNAGQPYIFFSTVSKLEVVMSGEHAGAGVGGKYADGKGLVGALENNMVSMPQNGCYINNNTLYKYTGTTPVALTAERAYIDLDACTAENNYTASAPVRIINGQNVATGIEELNTANQPVKFIENGKLYIRTANGVYDVTGRLAK